MFLSLFFKVILIDTVNELMVNDYHFQNESSYRPVSETSQTGP